jgi:excinuclease ABC subunit C
MPFDPKQLENFPTAAGIYIMKNAKDTVIYVGKAKSLQKRLKQYFAAEGTRDSRATIPFLLAELAKIETVVVSTEKEALLLENTFIKKYQPKFNILLKDDKNYISLSINLKEEWPRLRLQRFKERSSKDTLYFGPYTSTAAAKKTFELMSRLFPLRQCSNQEFNRRTRPCLLYSMKKCIAPCTGLCTKEQYTTYVESAIDFLKGNSQSIVAHLTKEMKKASDELEFEKAGSFLHTIEQIKHVTQEKTIFQKSNHKNIDVLGLYREGDKLLIKVLFFREGDLFDSSNFLFSHVIESTEEILSSFILQLYSLKKNSTLPEEILSPFPLPNEKEILSLLQDIHPKAKCMIKFPQKGNSKELINLAQENAKSSFLEKAEMQSSKDKILLELQEKLHLSQFPNKIECFDTSNLSGSNLVASSVVFTNGEEDKKKVRLYHIKGIDKPDDYAALHQALTRRILRAKEEDDFPDLFIIDGGKGQLGIALDVLKEHGLIHVNVVSIVKEKGRHDKGLSLEKVFIPGQKEPISFPFHSPILFFLQKIRDVAHEKAISFYRKTHSKKNLQSAIDSIPGIGPIKKKRLLQAFGSMQNILNQSEDDLKKIDGITSKDIEEIKKISKK